MNKRNASLQKYGISGKRYKELCGFCEQYPEWKEELSDIGFGIKSQNMDGMPHSNTNSTSDETADIAIKRAAISGKIKLIEDTAKEASPDLWEIIIKSACYEQPFWYLRDISMVPISRASFYDHRKYFFYLLNKKKKI